MSPEELRQLVRTTLHKWRALGEVLGAPIRGSAEFYTYAEHHIYGGPNVYDGVDVTIWCDACEDGTRSEHHRHKMADVSLGWDFAQAALALFEELRERKGLRPEYAALCPVHTALSAERLAEWEALVAYYEFFGS